MKEQFSKKQIHILSVAEELISNKGIDKTSVRDICGKAGINVAMISYYFGSKSNMMAHLYQYRIQKTRVHFSEYMDTIKNANPEMQMKEIIKYIVNAIYKYNYFHGFATQEYQKTEEVNEDLIKFYRLCVEKIDEIIKKGVTVGVFLFAPKAEDVLSLIIGTSLFAVRNRTFMETYLPDANNKYNEESEKKVKTNLLITVFALLGFTS